MNLAQTADDWQRLDQMRRRRSALRIRAIRKALGFKQLEFAFYLGVGQTTVSNWETGNRLPSHLAEVAIRALSSAYGLDLNDERFRRLQP